MSDDVITWHGSDDAMVWTAEPPRLPDPAVIAAAFAEAFRPGLEAASTAAEQLGRRVQDMRVALRSPIGQLIQMREIN
ncbi:hypothetical protein [Streptosporangium sp. NPDC051022]|uniref:hypothetical protein n=1 Tax=Streptosporangium sp. NPDC051022 TaxID=3155752 RepID=UPI00343C9B2F